MRVSHHADSDPDMRKVFTTDIAGVAPVVTRDMAGRRHPDSHPSQRARFHLATPTRTTACNRISPNDGHYFFAYYDKLQFSVDNRLVLMQRADFCDRQPRPDDALRVGMVDRAADHNWIELGQTTAWCWQQGCMLQWLPGSSQHIIYNVRGQTQYQSVLKDVNTGRTRILPRAIYCIRSDGVEAISLDFDRLAHTRPGYGYSGHADAPCRTAAPDDTGIWSMQIADGRVELLRSVGEVAAIRPNASMHNAVHWFNHALYNPSGSRFIVLHRWKSHDRRHTRMYTCHRDGSNLFCISDSTAEGSWHASHFWWWDDHTIVVWGENFDERGGAYLVVRDGETRPCRVLGRETLVTDGHMSFAPGERSRWMLSDTYPDSNTNLRALFLYDVESDTQYPLVELDAGPYSGYDPQTNPLRCDLHPRWDRSGNCITFDSIHEGFRAIYMVDVAPILANI